MLLSALIFCIVSCVPVDQENIGKVVTEETTVDVTNSADSTDTNKPSQLEGTRWMWPSLMLDEEYPDLPSERITLEFLKDGIISGDAGCNNYSGQYTDVDGRVMLYPAVHTNVICQHDLPDIPEEYIPDIMAAESTFLDALQQSKSYHFEDGGSVLHLELENGSLRFVTAQPIETTLFVAAETVDCVSTMPQTCLQVRYAPDEELGWLYDGIVGFDHEEGSEYELQIRILPIPHPEPDRGLLEYELIEIVSQKSVQ